jgi:predicted branched-subunit amino acid permease
MRKTKTVKHANDQEEPPQMGTPLPVLWQTSTAVGVFLGAEIPASWKLDFALALTFIGIVVPLLATHPMLAAAGVAAVIAHGLPYNLGLVLAGLAGIGVGVWMERQ